MSECLLDFRLESALLAILLATGTTLTQVGTAFGLAISTIVYNAALSMSSLRYGVHVNKEGRTLPDPLSSSSTDTIIGAGQSSPSPVRSWSLAVERRKVQDTVSESTCVTEAWVDDMHITQQMTKMTVDRILTCYWATTRPYYRH
ncbi:hypothetical protein BN946_scf184701.g8 [Trametes cinnabarina]|uniref:Uncharacterized protein n=1 Tax=Pycnoporus cinnabarinus TaxID=5643 RepID=A0A060SUZ4_PYCCI|nr:hypothetical protein BN946_scf184701.g8 [Trametes cinnabarina]